MPLCKDSNIKTLDMFYSWILLNLIQSKHLHMIPTMLPMALDFFWNNETFLVSVPRHQISRYWTFCSLKKRVNFFSSGFQMTPTMFSRALKITWLNYIQFSLKRTNVQILIFGDLTMRQKKIIFEKSSKNLRNIVGSFGDLLKS